MIKNNVLLFLLAVTIFPQVERKDGKMIDFKAGYEQNKFPFENKLITDLSNCKKMDFYILTYEYFHDLKVYRVDSSNIIFAKSNLDSHVIKEITSIFLDSNNYSNKCFGCGPIMTNKNETRYEMFRVYTDKQDTIDIIRKFNCPRFNIIYRIEEELLFISDHFDDVSRVIIELDILSHKLYSIYKCTDSFDESTLEYFKENKSFPLPK